VKTEVEQAITKFERELASKSKSNPKLVYAYVNSKTNIKDSIRALKDKDEKIITDGPQIANILNNYFGSVFCERDLSNILTCENKTNTKCSDPTFEEIIQKKN
jgi:hypothetical protein